MTTPPTPPADRSTRTAGVLLHPTALPGSEPCGTLGNEADAFVAWLRAAGFEAWQVLPLGPPGAGDAPYSSPSSFAFNPDLLSLRRLARDGWIAKPPDPAPPGRGHADFAGARRLAEGAVLEARDRLALGRAPKVAALAWEAFRDAPPTSRLESALLYTALRTRLGTPWWTWPDPLRDREPAALAGAATDLADDVERHRVHQFLVHAQWSRVREHARSAGLTLVGDLPIYVAHDSADVWESRDVFRLDHRGRPTHVAGVPPDYFSETGQWWGNPLYDWEAHAATGYAWWIDRVRYALAQTDLLRLDHFRGFEAYWEIPVDADSAAGGTWRKGPGAALFDALRAAIGALPFIAEDLGDISDEVHALRRGLGIPGMKVLQFGFGEDRTHHPASVTEDDVAYTGTHDNDTTLGWFRTLDPETRARVIEEVGEAEMPDALVRRLWETPSRRAIVPFQDLCGAGSEARFNTPGAPEGNWLWRATGEALDPRLAERIASDLRSANRYRAPGDEPARASDRAGS